MRGSLIMLFAVSSSLSAFGQLCKTCYLDYKVCEGYYSSTLCVTGTKCSGGCEVTKVPFLDSRNPGILPEQRAGKLLVGKVIYNSPAQSAGVEAGDEILTVNGRNPLMFACGTGWADEDGVTAIELRRGSEKVRLQMHSVPVGSMLGSPDIVPSSRDAREPFELESPFTFGFRWQERRGSLEISQILAGSPAYGAGLKVGDKIVSASAGGVFSAAGAIDVSQMRDGDVPKQINIVTADGAVRRSVVLRSRGISEILASPARPKARPQIERAGLNATTAAARLK